MNILIIEDDKETAENISSGLKELGFLVDLRHDGQLGLEAALANQYDVLIIDRMLPIINGLEIIKDLRNKNNHIPILMLSALGEIDDKVLGLNSGADDYMAKPFAFAELVARLNVLGKRNSNSFLEFNAIVAVGSLTIDKIKREAYRDGKIIILKPREFQLLNYFVDHVDEIITRNMLLKEIWGYDFDPQTNIVDVHISKLRNSIDKDFDTETLLTVRGKGYKLISDN